MKNYELVTIINPNLSSKVDAIKSDLEKLLSDNSFNIVKTEDIGRRQLAYTINNHHKGHYLIYSLEGNPAPRVLALRREQRIQTRREEFRTIGCGW